MQFAGCPQQLLPAQVVPICHLLLSPAFTALRTGGVWSSPGLSQGCCPLPTSRTSWLSNPRSMGPEESPFQGSFLPREVFKSSSRAKMMLLNDKSTSWDESEGTARVPPSQHRQDGALLPSNLQRCWSLLLPSNLKTIFFIRSQGQLIKIT